jgi:AcrR family transcriptional regulator
MFMGAGAANDTRERVLAAASELFAEHGFRGTTVRDIAERARVNIASGNYHYGSKKELYLQVLRTHFQAMRSLLMRRRASVPLNELDRLSPAELDELLQKRILTMLETLLGPPPGLHGTLMVREFTDPSEALPDIVDEFIRPMKTEMEQIVAHRMPQLDQRGVERCVMSIVGQVLFFRFAMPVALEILGRKKYPREFCRETAEHIARFSLGGMQELARNKRRKRRAR